jgi:hypothetical protein
MSEPQPVHRIEAGQEYVSVQPTVYDENGRLVPTCIRVVKAPDRFGGKPLIATIAPSEREIRRRHIDPRQLHDNPARKTGYRLVANPNRRTGYRLVTPVDGAAADGAQQ